MQTNVAKEYHGETRELRGLFEKQLKELYWTENEMPDLLAGIVKEATSADLVSLLQSHIPIVMKHSSRLEKIFADAGLDAEEQKYAAMECLIRESINFIEQTKKGVVRDAGIIAVLQKMKHYEIACYGTMRAYAIALREEDTVTLLEDTLNEVKEGDLALSAIAESHINTEAADKEI